MILLALMSAVLPLGGLWGALESTAWSATFPVINTSDSGPGSLRQAIIDANNTPGLDMITFNIPPGGPVTIAPTSALPTITDSAVIDGTTQPLFPGTPIIELSGANAATPIGLLVGAAPNASFIPTITIRGLVINRFDQDEIRINRGSGHVIEGNFIGTDITGTVALSTNNRFGLTLIGVSNTRVGGTTTAARNLISGNGLAGIQIFDAIGASVTGLVIEGNLIGTDINGNPTVGNTFLVPPPC
jgi:hypothetical protein